MSAHTLSNAATKALERELAIVLAAADRMAAGYGLAWSDYTRLHSAHQHLVSVLAAVSDREVTV